MRVFELRRGRSHIARPCYASICSIQISQIFFIFDHAYLEQETADKKVIEEQQQQQQQPQQQQQQQSQIVTGVNDQVSSSNWERFQSLVKYKQDYRNGKKT